MLVRDVVHLIQVFYVFYLDPKELSLFKLCLQLRVTSALILSQQGGKYLLPISIAGVEVKECASNQWGSFPITEVSLHQMEPSRALDEASEVRVSIFITRPS